MDEDFDRIKAQLRAIGSEATRELILRRQREQLVKRANDAAVRLYERMKEIDPEQAEHSASLPRRA